MITLVRLIYGFLVEEESKALKYIRKHPRRISLMSLDAILAITLVTAGFSGGRAYWLADISRFDNTSYESIDEVRSIS